MNSLEANKQLKQDILNLYKKRKEELNPYKIQELEKEIAAMLQSWNKIQKDIKIEMNAITN